MRAGRVYRSSSSQIVAKPQHANRFDENCSEINKNLWSCRARQRWHTEQRRTCEHYGGRGWRWWEGMVIPLLAVGFLRINGRRNHYTNVNKATVLYSPASPLATVIDDSNLRNCCQLYQRQRNKKIMRIMYIRRDVAGAGDKWNYDYGFRTLGRRDRVLPAKPWAALKSCRILPARVKVSLNAGWWQGTSLSCKTSEWNRFLIAP